MDDVDTYIDPNDPRTPLVKKPFHARLAYLANLIEQNLEKLEAPSPSKAVAEILAVSLALRVESERIKNGTAEWDEFGRPKKDET